MEIAHRIRINAPAANVFALYQDIEAWTHWDSEVKAVDLSDGLKVGSHGWLQPRNGPKARIQVSQVVPGSSFTIVGLLPLCRMEFGHDLHEDMNGTIAVHSVCFFGPLAFFFRRVIGREINQTLPSTLEGLKRASEDMKDRS